MTERTPSRSSATPTTVMVCTNCRHDGDDSTAPRAGAELCAALTRATDGCDDVRVVGVECLSVCKRPVTIAFAAAAKWTYVYGDFAADGAEAILAAARLYGETDDGLIPWKNRPPALKKGVVARIPALSLAPALEDTLR